jgi:DNA-directed RNA polymerase subunit RPC12/RpoP
LELITKKCPNCGASIDSDPALETAVCLYCDSIVEVKQTPVDSDTFILYTLPQKKLSIPAKTVLIVLAIIGSLFIAFILILIAGHSMESNAPNPNSANEHRVNRKFTFNDWELTIGDTVEWLKGELSEDEHPNSQTYMVKVPVTVTNKGDETRSFAAFTVNIYGATGLQLSRILNFNYDDSIANKGNDMPAGATESNIFIYFPYDGEGDYFISFSWLNIPTQEVKINIGQP